MTTRHRSFTQEPREPFTFDINGEVFTCVDDVPAGVLIDYAGAVDQAGRVPPAMLPQFFKMVLVEDDHERFAKVIRSPGGPGLALLTEIVEALVEELVDFPTHGPSGSPEPPSPTGTGSKGKRASKGSTSGRSQPRRR